jgi:hypothetical protein
MRMRMRMRMSCDSTSLRCNGDGSTRLITHQPRLRLVGKLKPPLSTVDSGFSRALDFPDAQLRDCIAALQGAGGRSGRVSLYP